MKCAACACENPSDSGFCEQCGAKLERVCPSCGTACAPAARFCRKCGSALSAASQAPEREPRDYTPQHLAERILAEQAALEARGAPGACPEPGRRGERKTITALFADIKGSMELLEDLDPEDARRLIDPALQLMMDAVHRYEGYVAQSTGDGIFALFGAPIAHEDHPRRACYAALRMQEQAERYGDQLQRDKGIRLPIRVGINTGEVVVRSIRKDDLRTEYVPVGHSTSLAARMESLAKPGTIVVSQHTHKLTEGYFQFKALGPAKVKGVSEPVEIYEVTGVGPLRTRMEIAAQRGLVRFVGRRDEMEQMCRAWEAAQAGHGQIVSVMGEAGVGKSRLFYEFKIPLESQCLVLEAFSVSHGKAYAYLPLIELLKSYFRICLEDDERTKREKVAGKLIMLDRTLENTLPYLFSLLGIAEPESSLQQMDAQIRRRRTMEAVKRVLVRETLNQPLVLIFEDLHWIDGETQAFLDVLADSVATAKILLLVNYRPECQHGWASKTYYTRLRLDPLGKEEAGELLTVLLGDGAAPGVEALKQLILGKTEGNPFFMEEVVQTLAEERVLAGERGSYRLDKPATELHIPTTVQGVLAARIDRLPAEEKALLQTLAVTGKEFTFGLVRKVTGQQEEALHRLFAHLQAGEFIYEQPAFPEPEYTFKHALTQEVAYQSVLVERRKVLHERTAQAMEELYWDGLDAHYNELAHHYGRTDNAAKAVEYLRLAGRQATDRSAYEEAIRHLSRGLELLKTLPESPECNQQELRLQMTLGQALMATKGWTAPEVQRAYSRVRELCQQVGDSPQLFPALFGLWVLYYARAELCDGRELGQQMLSLAEHEQEPIFLSVAHSTLGYTLFWQGKLTQSREHCERAVALYDPQRHQVHASLFGYHAGVGAGSAAASALWLLGYPDQALQRSRDALTLARNLSHPLTLAIALAWIGGFHADRGDAQAARELADALIEISNEHGFPDWLGWGMFGRGRALAEQRQREEGITQMRQVVGAFRATGYEIALPSCLGRLAEALGRAGEPQEGVPLLAEAVDVMNRTGQYVAESYLHRFKGDLLLAVSKDSEAETCFRQAIEVARRQGAKSYELQAAMSLARLWQRQGKKEEARQLLAEIYGWFTEGFDTRDLKEAKALLEELR